MSADAEQPNGARGHLRRAGLALATIFIAILIANGARLALQRPIVLDAPRNHNASSDRSSALPDMRLDLNRASAAELALLPGLGPRLAERIVDDRAARGPFNSIEELSRVSGIGAVTIERVRPYLVIE